MCTTCYGAKAIPCNHLGGDNQILWPGAEHFAQLKIHLLDTFMDDNRSSYSTSCEGVEEASAPSSLNTYHARMELRGGHSDF